MFFLCLTSTIAESVGRPPSPAPAEDLLAAVAAGSEEALAALYEQTSSAVYGFALSLLRNRQDAEDIMQETYVRLAKAASGYRPEGKPMAWILTIVRNLARMRLREESRLCHPEAGGWASSEPVETLSDDRLVLEIALRRLEDEERQIVMLHAVSGLKHREIAVLLERPLSTVLSRYHRALSKLRRELLRDGGTPRPPAEAEAGRPAEKAGTKNAGAIRKAGNPIDIQGLDQ